MVLKLIIIAVSVFVSLASAACNVPWPNGTDVKEHWWMCPGINQVYNVTPTDAEGNYAYPVHLYLPFKALLDVENVDHVYPYGSLRDDVNIWAWGGNLDCHWLPVPTLGLLANEDSCDSGLHCPIYMGRQWLWRMVYFSEFQSILDILKDDVPYQMQYVLKDHENGNRVVACVFIQARCRTHP